MWVRRRGQRAYQGVRGSLWAHRRSVLALHRRGLAGPGPRSRREYFVGNLGHMATLVARAFELVLARLAAAVEAGDGGGSVGRTTGNLTQLSQPSEAVG